MTIMEAYLSETPIDLDQLKKAIRRATIELEVVPVLCGSALKNKGIQPLLDAIGAYLPSPAEVHAIEGIDPETGTVIKCSAKDSAPLAALIFKVSMVEGRKLSYVRVYSGRLTAGNEVYNPAFGKKRNWPGSSECTPTSATALMRPVPAVLWALSA